MRGQITIFEYLYQKEQERKKNPVRIAGICDDAYCPICGYPFDDLTEKDCETCPVCHAPVDWGPWHRANDQEGAP